MNNRKLSRSRIAAGNKLDGQKGQAVVEFMMILFVVVVLTFGGIQLAQGVALRHAMDTGTSVAARSLSLDPSNWTFASGLIQTEVDENVLGLNPTVTVQVYDTSGGLRSAGWLSSLSFGESFIIESSVPFNPQIPLLTSSAVEIRVRHWGVVERYP